MRKIYILFLMLIIGLASEAQPQYWNHTSTGGTNTFPFNTAPATGKKVQWVVAPGEFVQPGPMPAGNNITSIWFRSGTTSSSGTYNMLTVRMATVSTSTFLSTGAFYTGPMTTLLAQNTTLASTGANTWVEIPLTTPYLYDPTMNLIIEVSNCGRTGTGFNIRQQAYGAAPDRRRQYSNANSLCGVTVLPTGGDQNVAGIGLSVVLAASPCAQNFDGVVAPALPASWTASTPTTCPGSLPWATTNAVSSSAPNSAFTNDPGCISDEVLDSRIFPIISATAQLTFQNNYNLESTFDGMVLEISIGGGPFVDIITAGGSFVTGGYNGTISLNFFSPIAGRQAWTGDSGGFITTTVNLPAAANGQNVVFRWRRATDNSVSRNGVWIDDITLTGSDCAAACTITCPANITVNNDPNACGAVVNYPAPTTNGACGPVTTSPASGSLFPVGTTTVTASTFASPSCTFTVTVNDVQPPVITCPANMTVNNTPGICGAYVTFSPVATDNCPGVVVSSVPASGSLFPVGTTTVNSTATDASGNTATCSFTITVIDNEPPTFTAPGLFPEILYYQFNGSGTSVPNMATAPPPGTATATIVGGQTQGAPGLCGSGSLIGNGGSSTTNYVNTNWATNLGTSSWTIAFRIANIQPSGTLYYIFGDNLSSAFRCFTNGVAGANNWMLRRTGMTDVLLAGGATVAPHTCAFVYDNTANNIKAYLDGVLVNTVAQGALNITGPGPFKVGAYDGNTGLSNGGQMDEFGIFSRALTPAEVLSYHNTCPANINNCPSDITVNNTPGICGAVVNYTTPVGVDNCPGVVTTQIAGLPSGGTFPIGTTTNTFRAMDAGGLTALCTFNVTVADNEAPTITCPTNITANTDVGVCTATIAVPNPITADNCAVTEVTWVMTGATIASSPATGINYVGTHAFGLTGTTGQGVTTVTYTIKDAAGLTATCSYTVTVNDAWIPVISGQPSNQFVCVGSNGAFTVTASVPAGNPLTYQWQAWNGSAWVNITGATAVTLPLPAVLFSQNTSDYRCILTGRCSVVTSGFATLYVNQLPTISLLASRPLALLPGNLITLTALASPGGGSYQWSKNGSPIAGATGSALVNLSVSDIGSYACTYTDGNGCVKTSDAMVVTGQASDNIWLYPNPNTGQFQVRFFNAVSEAVNVNIFDAAGARVYTKTAATILPYTSISIDVSFLPAGNYLVSVINSTGKIIGTKKVSVNIQQ